MDDKQKQIIGYFIEEAKEHLHTIESSLLGIEEMMSDPENINEVFRAAHSIKGGAAMLGFQSIQHLAHSFEDHFKVLRDNPKFPIDQDLQTLFLQGYDKLKDLVDHLQSPDGLTKATADAVLAEAEPLFEEIKNYIQAIQNGETPQKAGSGKSSANKQKEIINAFQQDVTLHLRDMLTCFKQPDSPKNRQSLHNICQKLIELGDRFGLTPWSDMVRAVDSVVTSANNQFRVLAPAVIKEIKVSQDLVVAGQWQNIHVSDDLKRLMPSSSSQGDGFDSIISGINPSRPSAAPLSHWQKFGQQVGWHNGQKWVTPSPDYSGKAPAGHLPAPIWLQGWANPQDTDGKQLEATYQQFMQRLSDAGIQS
jgi:chemosensory pili system protein ChpA (sensor histidine kinase/response regulator)